MKICLLSLFAFNIGMVAMDGKQSPSKPISIPHSEYRPPLVSK